MSTNLEISKVVWEPEYSINDLEIDKEHQNLFSIAKTALDINSKHNDNEEKIELKDIISKLFTSVKIHFEHEQEYMEKINYPQLQNHKKLHKNMLDTSTKLVNELCDLNSQEIEVLLFEFIDEYFIQHIKTEDKKIQLWHTTLEDLRKTFAWKDIYSINDIQIDAEHKRLLDMAQEAFKVVDPSTRNIKIKDVLNDLYDYMKTHFKHEEAFMLRVNYPQLNEHKMLHIEIVNNTNNFITQFSTLDITLLEKELANLIDISLVKHFVQEDKKIIDWIKSDTYLNKVHSI